jgi:hypothetical protein
MGVVWHFFSSSFVGRGAVLGAGHERHDCESAGRQREGAKNRLGERRKGTVLKTTDGGMTWSS